MGWFNKIAGSGALGLGLFGASKLLGDNGSNMDGVNYPDWYEDPQYKTSQDFLSNYSQDLLTKGPNDYYKPIGEYGTPEFMDFIQQGNSKTMLGVDEALSRTGRARGGQGAAIAAQALGDKNANLMYSDYLRAMEGRQNFMNIGLNTQANVRDAAFNNQTARNNFNVGGAKFDFDKAVYGDQRDDAQSAQLGKILGTVAGGGIGFMLGGPAGAMAGAGMGGSLMGGSGGGGNMQWLDLVKSGASLLPGASSTGVANGVSGLGAINSSDFLKQYSPSFGTPKPASMFNSSLLPDAYGGF